MQQRHTKCNSWCLVLKCDVLRPIEFEQMEIFFSEWSLMPLRSKQHVPPSLLKNTHNAMQKFTESPASQIRLVLEGHIPF